MSQETIIITDIKMGRNTIHQSHSHHHCNPIGIEHSQIDDSISNSNQCTGCKHQLCVWIALESIES